MRTSRAFLGVTATLVLFATSLPAQTRVMRTIIFTGVDSYTQPQLLAFTGLKPGASVTQQQIQDAAQKLGDTGLFEDISFSGNDTGVTFTLKPAATNTMLPARFANFVWWQDDDLNRALAAKVPLYRGTALPISGNLRETAASVLTAMVAEKGLAGASVGSHLAASLPGTPPDHIVFTIDNPPILVHSVGLTGVSSGMARKLDRVRTDLSGQPWDALESFINLSGRVGDVYRNDGYLDIAIEKTDHSAPVANPVGIGLDITAAVNEGAQYHVKQLAWAGSGILSTEDFRNRAALHTGDPASPLKLAETLALMRDAYGSKGYIDAKVEAPDQTDRIAHEVSYSITVLPGPQYHLHSVRFPNVSVDEEKQFLSGWKMKPGDVYDESYAPKFIAQHPELAQHGYTVSIQEAKDKAASVVDLRVLINKPGAPAQ